MRADLHLHSSASDGTDSPTELMKVAFDAELEGVALVDHDTLSGIDEARNAAQQHGIVFIPGTELSVDHTLDDGSSVKIHMLVYGLEPGDGPLQGKLEWLREGRAQRNPEIIEKLRGRPHCYDIKMTDVEAQAGGESVGRPHIADALVALGHVPDRDAAFNGILNDGGSAYVERARLTATEAIELATSSGAVTVIAHPLTMGIHGESFIKVLDDLKAVGLTGLEAHHPLHDVALRETFTEVANDMGLLATGGSDYHGTGKKGYSVGTGKGDLKIPNDAFEQIQQAIADTRSVNRKS